MRNYKLLVLAGALLSFGGVVQAQSSVLVVNANDNENNLLNTALSAAFTTVDNWDLNVDGTPTVGQLSAYNTVLAYTDFEPDDPAGTGDVLADYVDAGGCVVIMTYAFSNPWTITGRITDPGYSPLTDLGTNGAVSGNLNALLPADPIFDGVDLGALSYFQNQNFAQPGLDAGATLVADDGTGINMIARNANGNVVGLNLYPGDHSDNNDQLYALVANAAADCSGFVTPPAPPIPVPVDNFYALLLLVILLGGVGYVAIRRYHWDSAS